MSVSITMPQLGESVTEGTVTRWLKDVGDTVEVDEPLLEVSTDKVDTEIPSPVAGVLLEIKAVEDDTIEVGGELAIVGEASEAGATAGSPTPAETPEPEPAPIAASAPSTPEPAPAPASDDSGATPAPAASAGAATDIVLPALGESVTEGTVTRWLKDVGDTVEVDEPLLEVSTDKVDTEIPSPVAGVLTEILVPEDETVDVGGVLARVGSSADAAPAPTPSPSTPEPATVPTPAEPSTPTSPTPTPPATAPAPAETGPAYASPIVRKQAREAGVDLSTVTPTGEHGQITRADLSTAPSSAPAPSTPAAPSTPTNTPTAAATTDADSLRGTTVPMTRLRRVIAERMVESLHVSAQLTTVVEVDLTRIAHLRERAKGPFRAREGVGLSYLPFFARAALEALKIHPNVNASIDPETLDVTYHAEEHLGIAVDTNRGLLVPVIRDAGDLTISGLARRIADLGDRARASRVMPDELSGGTFTITNTGSRGSLFDTPIINQPQVAILGSGAVVKRPVVVPDMNGDDVIAIRSMVYLALTYDHRIIDGADAARFLTTVKQRLESGEFEAELGV